MEKLIVCVSLIIICSNIVLLGLKVVGIPLRSDILGCGLVGYSGSHVADKGLLKLLMMYNLERGKDATGWVIDNKITKDTVAVSKFMSDHKLNINESDSNYTFIGHARQSSSGWAKNKDHAHPFGCYQNEEVKETFDLVLAMNGTVNNMFDLSKTFEVKFTHHTNSDTQVISQIMANLGEKNFPEFLEKYEGAATLLFFFPKNPNTLYVYKDPGRTLFCWNKEKDEIYISSLEDSLSAIGAHSNDIRKFEDDHFYKIESGVIVSRIKIGRPKPKIYTGYYHGWAGDYSGGSRGNFHHKQLPLSSSIIDNSSCSVNNFLSKLTVKPNDNKVYYCLSKYKRNGHALNGPNIITKEGDIVYNLEKPGSDTYYFIDGYMLRNKQAFDDLSKKLLDCNASLSSFPKSHLIEYMMYPIITTIKKVLYFVLPDWFVEQSFKLKIKDSIAVISPMFSNINIIVSFPDEVIEKTGKYLAIVNKIEESYKKTQVTNLQACINKANSFTKEENFAKLNKLILTDKVTDYLDIVNEFKSVFWKVNTFPAINKYFFDEVFIAYMRSNNIAESATIDQYIVELGKTRREYPIHEEDMKFPNDLIRFASKQEDEESKRAILHLSTKEKVSLITQASFCNYSKDEVYEAIKETSDYYSNMGFRDAIINGQHKSVKDFAFAWIAEENLADDKVTNEFCDSLIVALKEIGTISLETFFDIISKPFKYKLVALEHEYESFISELTKDEISIETIEANIEDMFSGAKQSIDMVVQEIMISDNKSERMYKILQIAEKMKGLILNEEEKVELNEI